MSCGWCIYYVFWWMLLLIAVLLVLTRNNRVIFVSHYHTICPVSPFSIVAKVCRKCQDNLWKYRFRGFQFITSVSLLRRFIDAAVFLFKDECFGQGHCMHVRLYVAAECLLALFALARKRLGIILVSDVLAFCASCLSSSGCVHNSMVTENQH